MQLYASIRKLRKQVQYQIRMIHIIHRRNATLNYQLDISSKPNTN